MKKKQLTKPNIPLLRRLQRTILKHHDQFQMSSLFSSTLDLDLQDVVGLQTAGGCGTAACFAGWLVHMDGPYKKLATTNRSMHGSMLHNNVIPKAAKLIGVPMQQCRRDVWTHSLFYIGDWPKRFYWRWKQATTSQEQARVAADVLEDFISKHKNKKGKK